MNSSQMRPRLKLAYVSPLNPIPSGLSDYSETLLPALSEYFDTTLYSDCGEPANPTIARRFVTRPVSSLQQHHAQHDLRLYQLGNSTQHQNAFDTLRRLPGVVTLHEPFLHTGIRAMSPPHYRRELSYELGNVDDAAVNAWAAVRDRVEMMAAPLIGRAVDSSLGLIVHSRTARRMIEDNFARRAAKRHRAVSDIAVIPQPMPLDEARLPQDTRAEFGLSVDGVLFGSLGLIDPTKEPTLAVRAFARVLDVIPQARLVFVGERPNDFGLDELMRDLGVAGQVIFLGRVEPIERMHRAIAACDVILSLRRPTIGETSATALRSLAIGRAQIVRDVDWYSELPDAACAKIDPQAEVDELAQAMLELANSPDRRRQMGEAARHYIQTECDVAVVARRYADFLQATFERAAAAMLD